MAVPHDVGVLEVQTLNYRQHHGVSRVDLGRGKRMIDGQYMEHSIVLRRAINGSPQRAAVCPFSSVAL